MNVLRLMVAVCVSMLAGSLFADTLPKGTQVTLVFDQAFTSRTIKKGDKIKLHVADNLSVGSKVAIRKGSRVYVTIEEVEKSGRFGKNAQIKMSIAPIHTKRADIPLQPRQKGNIAGGEKGTQAAAASGAGLVVLGPIGLGAGYFIVGKQVVVKKGDKFVTQVSEDVHLKE